MVCRALNTDITVRTGTPEDVHGVMKIAVAACEENSLTGLGDIEVKKLLNDVWAALNLEHGIMGLIGTDPVEAGVLLRVEPIQYRKDNCPCLVERAIFVNPDYRRGGGRARLLCEWTKKVADELGIPLMIGVVTANRAEAKVRLYERQFGKPSGAYWVYRPNGRGGAII